MSEGETLPMPCGERKGKLRRAGGEEEKRGSVDSDWGFEEHRTTRS